EGPGPKPVDPDEVVEGIPTYATFNFVVQEGGAGTRAMSGDAGGESNAVNNLRMLIFKGSNDSIEANVYATGSALKSQTVKVSSGEKKIFIVANAGGRSNLNAELSAFQPGSSTKGKVADLLGVIDLVASEPSYLTATPYIPSTVPSGVPGLATLVDQTAGHVMTNALDNRCIKILNANVDSTDSNTGAPSAVTDNTNATNSITIGIQRTVAKVSTIYAASATSTVDGRGTLGGLKSVLQNVNRSLYLFQKFSGYPIPNPLPNPLTSYPQSPYYEYTAAPADTAKWKNHYYSYPAGDLAAMATTVGTSYYLTENTQGDPNHYRGSVSYVAIQGQYFPKANSHPAVLNYIAGPARGTTAPYNDSITFNAGTRVFTVKSTRYPAAAITTYATGAKLYQVRGMLGATGIPDSMFFTDREAAYFVAWCINGGNPTAAPGAGGFDPSGTNYNKLPAGYTSPSATAEYTTITSLTYDKQTNNNPGAALVYEYDQGYTYYRVPLYNPNGSPKTGVIRNHWYKVDVKAFKGIGETGLDDLNYPPDTPEEQGQTFVTATITIDPWRVVDVPVDVVE
ncbi:MAG: Mfa1 family fimbria major subunit, partial [Tannerella sp.]|nr:Mfa1 family fimbria major subunit [Tannerella sp.]